MEKIAIRLIDINTKKVLKNRKVFTSAYDAKEYIKKLFANIKENEGIKVNCFSPRYVGGYGIIYYDVNLEQCFKEFNFERWVEENIEEE